MSLNFLKYFMGMHVISSTEKRESVKNNDQKRESMIFLNDPPWSMKVILGNGR
jgi:hypothetical protein